MLRAENTKTARTRAVPIMSRMRGVLDSRRKGPDGQRDAPDCFVFGNEASEADKASAGRVRQHLPPREDRGPQHPRSAAGVWVSALGVRRGIHDVSYWLGHTNVATTSQYLKTTVERL